MKKIIELKNLSKSFSKVEAVHAISLDIYEGEFFSLLGPSGCGKTTILRMIAGLEFPSMGEIHIDGNNASKFAPHKRPVNMVFQNYALFPHLNVFENIAFGLRLTKTFSRSEIERRVKNVLELVQLPNIFERYPRELSGGQQQRVAFARAIVNEPKVLLLDEPLSALDPKIRYEMQAELARLKSELKITFVMVTHDQKEAFALSDRIALLSSGKLEQLASPKEIFENPSNAFVADFIGQSNILSGEIISIEGDFFQMRTASNLNLWVSSQAPVNSFDLGKKVTVLVRPSFIKLSQNEEIIEKKEEPVNVIPAKVLHRSFQGISSDIKLKLAEDVLWTASVTDQELQSNTMLGQSTYVVLPASMVQVIPSR